MRFGNALLDPLFEELGNRGMLEMPYFPVYATQVVEAV